MVSVCSNGWNPACSIRTTVSPTSTSVSSGVLPAGRPLIITVARGGVDSTRSRPTALRSACTVAVWPASTWTFCSNCL